MDADENECAYNKVRTCADEKGIDNCGLCEGYPCEKLSSLFEITQKLRSHASQVCTEAEMDALTKAFFSNQENLDHTDFSH